MKVIDPGHVYELNWLDGKPSPHKIHGDIPPKMAEDLEKAGGFTQGELGEWIYTPNRLTFVKREGDKYPGNVGHHPGTTMQEVLRALIDRLQYVDNQIPDGMNSSALHAMREAIFWLEARAAERHGRELPIYLEHIGVRKIETLPTCETCGHIGCPGTCQT